MISKFKSPEALLAAYKSLEKEFTRRSQLLRKLQKKGEKSMNEKDIAEQSYKNGYEEGLKAANKIDVHKLIDEAMEKKDRHVSIVIFNNSTTVNVYPMDAGAKWIPSVDGSPMRFTCSNCGHITDRPNTYCGFCGELLHGVKEGE